MLRCPALLASLLLLAAPAAAQQPVPATIPTGSLERGDVALRTPASTVAVGPAVVSAADPRAAEAGAQMLRLGGSATDAALATAIALTVVEPQSSGIGGGAFYLHHDAQTGRIDAIDGRETAPAAARPDRFLGPDGRPLPYREAQWGGRSVGVPGLIALAQRAHARHGKLPWATLFQPAIRLAADGFAMTPRLHRTIAGRLEVVAASGAASALLGRDGAPLPVGARVRQPELAATLRAVAQDGARAFYSGPVAGAIARAVSEAPRGPAPMTAADLAGYRPVERTPVCGSYRGWRICGMGPPSSGSIAVIQILNQLERFEMGKLGPDNPLAWHLFAESQRLAYADRAAWIGDPGFSAVPADGLTDSAYLAQRSSLIRLDRAMPAAPPGSPPGAPPAPAPSQNEAKGTSHLVAADAQGNVVTLTSTIETVWGSGQVAAGFFLNNELTDFDFEPAQDGRPSPNAVAPGKRPRSSMAPTLVYAPDGRLHAAVGAAGGVTIIAQVAKTLVAMIDWGMPVEEALALPTLVAIGPRLSYEGGTRLDGMAATWRSLGHAEVAPSARGGKLNALARAGDLWRAAADPRSEGQAVAVSKAALR